MDEGQAAAHFERWWRLLVEMAAEQTRSLASEEPTQVFVERLREAVDEGAVSMGDLNEHTTSVAGLEIEGYHGVRVWIAGDNLFVPKSIFDTLSRRGAPITMKPSTLWRRLKEKGLTICDTSDHDRTDDVKKIGGKTMRLLHFRRATVWPESAADMSPVVAQAESILHQA
jgi:hypothetical protein